MFVLFVCYINNKILFGTSYLYAFQAYNQRFVQLETIRSWFSSQKNQTKKKIRMYNTQQQRPINSNVVFASLSNTLLNIQANRRKKWSKL